jgi:DNA-binding MarR family transcriptional regulator
MSPVAIVSRLERVRRVIDYELDATFAEYGLNGPDFAALVTLRRLDQPEGVSQRKLMAALRLTSGTVSIRVDRLFERGLVTRSPDLQDRRNTLVALSEAGRALFERVAPAHLATEKRLLASLSSEQAEQLAALLRQLLVSFEGSTHGGEFPPLGLVLAPAHVTVEMRRALGLAEVVGLLVRYVAQGSRADLAGVKIGDVLVQAGSRELRSVISLYAAMNDTCAKGSLTVSVVRGTDESLEVNVDVRPVPGAEKFPQLAHHLNDPTTHII